jgi:hypothetical protein
MFEGYPSLAFLGFIARLVGFVKVRMRLMRTVLSLVTIVTTALAGNRSGSSIYVLSPVLSAWLEVGARGRFGFEIARWKKSTMLGIRLIDLLVCLSEKLNELRPGRFPLCLEVEFGQRSGNFSEDQRAYPEVWSYRCW